jgi:hypothetical protein
VESEPSAADFCQPIEGDEGELIEAVAVIETVRTIEPVRPATPALVQAAAVAATGFVAGAATVAVLNRRRAGGARGLPAPWREQRQLPAGESPRTQTFLVQVHALGRRGS